MLIVQNIFVLDVIKFGDKKVNYLVQKNGKKHRPGMLRAGELERKMIKVFNFLQDL